MTRLPASRVRPVARAFVLIVTVYLWVPPANADVIIGTSGDDTLTGTSASDTIQGLAGDDVLTGGGGNDTFIFAEGDGLDTVTDFTAGASTEDVIDISARSDVVDFNQVIALATDDGQDTTITFANGDVITLTGVLVSALHADDFLTAVTNSGPATSVSYHYDALGRLFLVQYNNSASMQYAYDPAGNRTSVVHSESPPSQAPPDAFDDGPFTILEEGQTTLAVLDNDTDPNGDQLIVTGKTDGAKGTVTIVNNGLNVQYTGNTNANGADSFTYTVSDGNGGTDTATVTMNITPVNDAPDAVDDAPAAFDEDTVLTFDPRTNDTDPEQSLAELTITDKTNGQIGAVAIVNGTQLQYTPNPNANGSDNFTYTLSDGQGGTDTATVSVDITPVPDPPNVVDDNILVSWNSTTYYHIVGGDPDGDPITITNVVFGGDIQSATIHDANTIKVVVGNQTFQFGGGSFTYTVTDGTSTDSATVNVAIH